MVALVQRRFFRGRHATASLPFFVKWTPPAFSFVIIRRDVLEKFLHAETLQESQVNRGLRLTKNRSKIQIFLRRSGHWSDHLRWMLGTKSVPTLGKSRHSPCV